MSGDEQCQTVIDIPNTERAENDFEVHFEKPAHQGIFVGYLLFEFEPESKLYIAKFEVIVRGQTTDEMLDSKLWVESRTIIRYTCYDLQPTSYEEKIKACKRDYHLKLLNKRVDMRGINDKNYAEKMHMLLYAEEKARLDILSRLNCKYNIQFGKVLKNGNMLGSFQITRSVSTDEALLFQRSCQMILIGKDESDIAYEGKIMPFTDTDMERVTIEITSECQRNLGIQPEDCLIFEVQFQIDRDLFGQRHCAIDNIKENIVFLCPSRTTVAEMKLGTGEYRSEKLNRMQNLVYEFLHLEKERITGNCAKPYPPLVVAGPFGTGKTYTIRQILIRLLSSAAPNKILVCTHTNSAADLYLEDKEIAEFGRDKILRVYYHKRELSSANENVRRFCLIDQGRFRYPTLEELRKNKLVITTFTTSMALFLESGITGGMFSHILLDEVAQVMEPDVVMPLLLADSKATRILLAGDHRQTTEKLHSDAEFKVKTILERLYEEYSDVSKRYRVSLTDNYRSVEGIVELISKLFYKQNALQIKTRETCISNTKAVYFIHVQGDCERSSGTEYVNGKEADEIVEEVNALIQQRGIKHDEIVILSAFRSQVLHIRGLLKKNRLANVRVMTVENIQGKEFKVVLITTVMRRRNCLETYGENFGLLSDYRLLNVALTRAKSLIIIFGDAVTLCSIGECEKYWKKIIQHCIDTDTLRPYQISVEDIKKEISLAEQTLRPAAAEFNPGMQLEIAKEIEQTADKELSGQDELVRKSGHEDVSSFDHDDADSWCCEGILDDDILDDMIKQQIGIDISKLTIGVGEEGEEYVDYGSEEEMFRDPNETHLGKPR